MMMFSTTAKAGQASSNTIYSSSEGPTRIGPKSRSFFWLLITFLAFDLLLVVLHIFFSTKLGFFHLDKEQNLGAVYSGFKLVTIGYASFALWYLTHEKLFPWLAGLFLYLGLDEMIVLHERIGFVMNNWFGVRETAFASFNWLLYFSPFILLGSSVLVLFLLRVRKNAPHIFWMPVAGLLFFFVSLGSEYINGIFLGRGYDTYFLITEEFSQMLGETFFLLTILTLLLDVCATRIPLRPSRSDT